MSISRLPAGMESPLMGAPPPPPQEKQPTMGDIINLSTFLTSLQTAQHALSDEFQSFESSSRTAQLNTRAMERDLLTLQKEVSATVGSVGELRVALGKVKQVTDNLPTTFNDIVRTNDLPCSRSEWSELKQLVQTLQTRLERPVEQTSTTENEIALLKAELSERHLANEQLMTQVRDLSNQVRNLSDEVAGASRKSDLHHSNLTIASMAEKSIQNRETGAKPGVTAQALLDLGKKKLSSSTPIELASTDNDDAAEQTSTSTGIEAAPIKANAIDTNVHTNANVITTGSAPSSSVAPDANIAFLEDQLRTVYSVVSSLQSELVQVRSDSNRLNSDLAELRDGFKDVHASMPIPFLAPPSPEERERPLNSVALQPTMIAVSLHCDLCQVNTAVVFCVHCSNGSQKLCGTCDSMLHAGPSSSTASSTNGGVDLDQRASPKLDPFAKKDRNMTATASNTATTTSNPNNNNTSNTSSTSTSSKHLRLEISKTIQPGSKLLSSDLSFIKNQSENHTLTSMKEDCHKLNKHCQELQERIDRHDLQFGSLAVSLNTVDELESKLALLERELRQGLTKNAEFERNLRETNRRLDDVDEKVIDLSVRGRLPTNNGAGGGGVATRSDLASMSQVSTTVTPVMAVLAQQLHSELDAHKKHTSHAFLELVSKLDTFQSVQLDAITTQLRHIEKNKIDLKQYLSMNERLIANENGLRSLGNTHTFMSSKLEQHCLNYQEWLLQSTCQHCDTHTIAGGGRCQLCQKRICWECSKLERQGHVSELRTMIGGGGGGDFSGGGGVMNPILHAARDAAEGVQELRAKVSYLYQHGDVASKERLEGRQRLEILFTMFEQMNLIIQDQRMNHTNEAGSGTAVKFGPSAALLLDTRTLGYFEALNDFFNTTLPNVLHRLGLHDQRCDTFSTSLSALERRNREFDVASRPFVEGRFEELGQQLGMLEKNMLKKFMQQAKKLETEIVGKLEKQRAEEREKIGQESSLARVTFRCLACDQPVHSLPGPLSKEYQAQLNAHNAIFHPMPPSSTAMVSPPSVGPSTGMVGGFSTPMPPLASGHTSASANGPLQTSMTAASNVANTNTTGGIGIVGTERGHLFIDPGTKVTLHSNTDSSIYRGREDTRISFIPAAPTIGGSSGDVKLSATFQTSYLTKGMVAPSGSVARSVGRAYHQRGGGGGGRKAGSTTGIQNEFVGWQQLQIQQQQQQQQQQSTLPQISGSASARSATNTYFDEPRPQTTGGGRSANVRTEEKFGE